MSNKRFVLPVILIVLVLCGAFSAYPQNQIPSNWKTYSGINFSFRYPSNLTVKVKNKTVELSHKIKFRHTDPCDASDKPKKFALLEDFNATFTVEKSNTNSETGGVTKEFWEKTSEGLIDTGNLKGSVALNTAEGCGEYVYTFPGKNGKTLLVKRLQISLFQPTSYQNGDAKKALKLKGVIKPEQESRIFKLIVESIKFK